MSLYDADGKIRLTITNGSTLTGAQAPDGSYYAVINDGTQLKGLRHPSGGLNAVLLSSPSLSLQAPNGSLYITQGANGYTLYEGGSVTPLNMVPYSETFTDWTPTGTTTTQFVDIDPYGEPKATRITEFAATSGHSYGSGSMSFTAGQAYTLSVSAKYESGQYMQILFGSAAFGVNAFANFDIQNGTTGTVGSAATASVTSQGNGWYRISITATATSTASTTIAIAAANASTMTRGASYAGNASITRLIAKAQVERGSSATTYNSTEAVVSFVGNTGNTAVGAIRWDAWMHPSADTVRTAVETTLGPFRYQWRLPFFNDVVNSTTVTCTGTQSDMDAEIAYAVEAGLDYWAFFWYGIGSTNGMKSGWDLYQSSLYRNSINWCLYFSGQTILHTEVTDNLAGLISYMQQDNYQKTASGRPLIYVFNDSGSLTNTAADIAAIRSAATTASLPNPYFVFTQSTPDDSVITTYGFDATTTYAVGGSVAGAQPFSSLDTVARAQWTAQAAENVDVVPMFTMGWDRRPRVENPVPWETPSGSVSDYYYPKRMSDISTHIDAGLAWIRANPTEVPENVALMYAWNEHDEGGWICPTYSSISDNKSHLNAVKAVLGSRDMLPPLDPPEPTGNFTSAYISQGIY